MIGLLLCAGVSGSCSSEATIRTHLENGDELPPARIVDHELIFIEVRGDRYIRSTEWEDFALSNVFLEIRPNRSIYSRKYSATWDDGYGPKFEFETLDKADVDEDQYQTLWERLKVYRPAVPPQTKSPLTPKDCSVPLGPSSPAIVSFGDSFMSADATFVFPSGCKSASGKVVKEDLNAILASIPPLEGLEGFLID